MIFNFLIVVFEVIKIFCVMNGYFNYKFKKSVVPLILGILYVVFVAVTWVVARELIFYNDFPFISLLSVFIVTFSLEGSYRFIVALLSFIGICGFDDLLSMLLTLIYPPTKEIISMPWCHAVFDCISILILALVAFILQKTLFKENSTSNYLVSKSNLPVVILFLVGESATFLCIAPLTELLQSLMKDNNIFPVVFVIIIALTVLGTGLLLYYTAFQGSYYKKLSDMNSELVQSQAEYYQMIMEKETETRKFRHDISNHLICLEQLLKESKDDDAAEYISQLIDSTKSLKSSVSTGNFLINVIITDLKAKYPTVDFTINGLFPEVLTISNMDVCTVFSNAIQNAFLAAGMCDGAKYVKMNVKTVSLSLYVIVENSKSDAVRMKNGLPVTTKKDSRNHGLGMLNIKNCVKKNNGSFEFSFTDHTFTAEIILPNAINF